MKKNVRYTSWVLASLLAAGIGFTQVQPVKAVVNYQDESSLERVQDQDKYDDLPSVIDVLQGAKNIDEKVNRTQKMIDYLQSEIVDEQNYIKSYQQETEGINSQLDYLKQNSPNQYQEQVTALKPSLDFNKQAISKLKDSINKENGKVAEFKNELVILNKEKENQNKKPTSVPSSSDSRNQSSQPSYQQPVPVTSESSDSNKKIGKEKSISGIVHINVPHDMSSAEVELLNEKGQPTGKYIPVNSNYKVFAEKTINGKLYYRLGTNNQWILATQTSQVNQNEKSVEGYIYVPSLKNKNTKIALLDGQGHYTGKYISANSNWKVFAKKIVNGKLYYRIGNQNQWVPAQYSCLTTRAERKLSGVAHISVINHNRNWKVALLNASGKATGKYISTNSNWKPKGSWWHLYL